MNQLSLRQSDQDLLRLGLPPLDFAVLDAMTVGAPIWETFLVEQYLAPGGYVAEGHSQIKFIIGRTGAGKTHLLRRLVGQAHRLGYITASLTAPNLRLQHIDSLYRAIAGHLDVQLLAGQLARRVASELGYELDQVPPEKTFLSWVVQEHQRIDILVRRDIEQVLGNLFKRERVDQNFSLAFTQLASDTLGTRPLSSEDRGILCQWLRGEKLLAEQLHHIHLSRGVDRHNARDMLHSLAGFAVDQGYKGLFVAIDQMEDLPLGRSEAGRLKYGGVALADAYQSLREMVDNLPSITGMMLILAGRNEFLELPRGIKSYDALWLRIQHEVVSPKFNRFAQVVDLDRAVQANLSSTDVESLHQRLGSLGMNPPPLDQIPIQEILGMGAGEGVYRRLMQAMLTNHAARR